MRPLDDTRRRFMASFSALGLGSTLVPGIVWTRMQDAGAERITLDMVTDALKLSGVDLPDSEREAIVRTANQNLARYEEHRGIDIPNDVSPPFHFSPLVPGMAVSRTRTFRLSPAPAVRRPANLESVAFWPVRHLAELVRTRKVTSLELTRMYLERLHRYNPTLNCVVTYLDDLAIAQAQAADREIAAGRYRGPLHGIPWGAKDIIAVKGHPTTWGTAPLRGQVFDYDASVVEMLREAGAVLVAKLTTGELAAGDQWFGGQTRSPWDPAVGSSGSSAGPASATAAGLVAFAIGTETSGSILSPSARCGVTGLRPTFGRISRHGVMALSWTQDRLGPICRHAEDCAIVMQAIAKPDGRDMSVSDVPFAWDAQLDVRTLRVGYIPESFDEIANAAVRANADRALETLQRLGVRDPVRLTVPTFTTNVGGLGVESAVFFDRMLRAGKMAGARGGSRAGAWLVPAVEYLQSQRLRMLMMMRLAEATADVDVYVVASANAGGTPGRGRGGDAADPAGAGAGRGREGGGGRGRGRGGSGAAQGPTQRHFAMANLAGYPAINVPNGFAPSGQPTNVTFYARPFGEAALLALARAYQDAAGFHLVRPQRLET